MQKTLKNIGAPLACALTLTTLTANDARADWGWHWNPPAKSNIAELAVATPELSTLVAALQRAGLVDTIANDGPFTVFAPTNQAFADLLAELGFSSLDQVPTDVLTDILLDHVVSGEFTARKLAFFDRTDAELEALGGLALDFDRKPVEVNDINVSMADICASNGVIHIIDAVLLDPDPRPTITELAAASPNLSILVEAVQRTGLDLVLANGKPFTVFAPTNQAFANLLAALGLSSLSDVDDRTLTNILLDHIVSRELDAVDVLKRANRRWGGRVRTLGNLSLKFRNHPLTVNGVAISATDIEAENGTVHIIDEVLLD